MTKIEEVARALARTHFERKQHAGACSREERLAYLVNERWRHFIPDARAAIEVMEPPAAMTDPQFQAILAWLTRIDARLETIERRTRPKVVDVRWIDPDSAETRAVVLCEPEIRDPTRNPMTKTDPI